MRSVRTAAAFAALMLASAVAAPSVGAYTETGRSGTVSGTINVQDFNGAAGVRCLFENNRGKKHDELNKIRIAPQFFHGHLDDSVPKTFVGYRFLIKENKPPFSDGKFKTIFRSKIIKKLANDAEVANFKARFYRVRENTKSRYRVQIRLFWYAPGSKTTKVGTTRGVMEVYDQKMKPKPIYTEGAEGATGFCNRNWHNGAP